MPKYPNGPNSRTRKPNSRTRKPNNHNHPRQFDNGRSAEIILVRPRDTKTEAEMRGSYLLFF